MADGRLPHIFLNWKPDFLLDQMDNVRLAVENRRLQAECSKPVFQQVSGQTSQTGFRLLLIK